MVQLVMVQANSAAQLTKDVNKLLGFNYSLVGAPFAVDSIPHQMMAKGDDSETPDREYSLLIRYGEMSMPAQLDDRLDEGWKLYGNVFNLGHLPVQAVVRGDVPVIGGNSGGDGNVETVDWAPSIEAAKKSSFEYTDKCIAESGDKIDKRLERMEDAANTASDAHIMLAQRVAVLEGDVSSLMAQLDTLSTELEMERNERVQDMMRLQAQIDAILSGFKAEPVQEEAVVSPKATNVLPDESVWR